MARQQLIIVLNIKGSDKAVADTEMMLESVVEAAQSQFPAMRLQMSNYTGEQVEKRPMLMVPTKMQKAGK